MIFPHPDREEWVADWGLTGGEVDILLGADMIHLFPKLDYTVEKLSLYMSFLTKRYIVMGQLPDNAPEEQLEAIKLFSEEHSRRSLHLTTLPSIKNAYLQPPRRSTSLHNTTSSAASGTVLGPAITTRIGSTTTTRAVGLPTDVPTEVASLTKATQGSQGRTTTLGHTLGHLQALNEEEEASSG